MLTEIYALQVIRSRLALLHLSRLVQHTFCSGCRNFCCIWHSICKEMEESDGRTTVHAMIGLGNKP